ncbi:MAG: hypothetical protein NTW33_10975 [Methanoregula sp.]|nr:hypothetical protein [Methanoregula sp.]
MLLTQLSDVSNIVLQIDEDPTPSGILVLFIDEVRPNYRKSKYNEQMIGAILDSMEGC